MYIHVLILQHIFFSTQKNLQSRFGAYLMSISYDNVILTNVYSY